jgi:hypothetical protein
VRSEVQSIDTDKYVPFVKWLSHALWLTDLRCVLLPAFQPTVYDPCNTMTLKYFALSRSNSPLRMFVHLLQDQSDEFIFDFATSETQMMSSSPVASKQLKCRLMRLSYGSIK